MRPESHTQLPNKCLCPLLCCFSGDVVFSESIMNHCRSLFVWRVRCTFSFRMCFSTLRPRAEFLISNVIIQSNNQRTWIFAIEFSLHSFSCVKGTDATHLEKYAVQRLLPNKMFSTKKLRGLQRVCTAC